MLIRIVLIATLPGVFVAACWAPVLFVESKLGPAGPCEVSNSCGPRR
jgi:hypothetical protein